MCKKLYTRGKDKNKGIMPRIDPTNTSLFIITYSLAEGAFGAAFCFIISDRCIDERAVLMYNKVKIYEENNTMALSTQNGQKVRNEVRKPFTFRLFALLLSVLFAVGLCACSTSAPPSPDDGKPMTYTATYVAGEGGYISGEAVQTVESGKAAEEVEAVAHEGYSFLKWNDGILTAKRTDEDITASFTVTALFEPNPIEEIIYDLPIMRITTDDGQDVVSKDYYKTCSISVSDTAEKYCFENESAGIRGRGNSSWEWPKKPYKVKFDSKIDLFGNGKAKKWTLIANYCDLSLARNFMVYSLGAEFEALKDTTTSIQFVRLYFNDRYDGVYLVCEQIETGSNRVDVEDDLEKFTDPENLGFLIELDRRVYDYVQPQEETFVYDGDYYFKLNKNYFGSDYWDGNRTPFTIKSPDPDDAYDLGLDFGVYVDYIRSYMNNAFEVLWGGNYNSVKVLFDVDSWAEGYIIDELFKNVDVAYSSFYMYKDDKDGKLYRGPLWDYDISSDNCNYSDGVNNKDAIYARYTNAMYEKLMEFSEFRALVTQKLNGKAAVINSTLDKCVDYLFANSDEFERNFERWPLLNWGEFYGWCPTPDHLRAMTTWEEEVTHLRAWLDGSLNYMLSVYRP